MGRSNFDCIMKLYCSFIFCLNHNENVALNNFSKLLDVIDIK